MKRSCPYLGCHLPRYLHTIPSAAVRVAGIVAGQAEQRKAGKYVYEELAATHHFVPVVVETTGVFGLEAHSFLQHIYKYFTIATVNMSVYIIL